MSIAQRRQPGRAPRAGAGGTLGAAVSGPVLSSVLLSLVSTEFLVARYILLVSGFTIAHPHRADIGRVDGSSDAGDQGGAHREHRRGHQGVQHPPCRRARQEAAEQP
ncbi:hypothetical protein SAV14893_001860 [Streptomyces avermitilis]|uniref:Uncharacterized protein n=1 Tax=Streptomyces avermitilis TaxID=33903 RepID=A0A4D4LRV7_STRAX|nr:hypothetical protein SAVMC3_13860 [Streptomyces avermitilis]GDY60793.1 hypothetical protein SAV14893_001860 [Streptomyces avermitilis]GDY88035.1 hypothetical protein SAVCW2_72340 [Streptomyces avermitilis]